MNSIKKYLSLALCLGLTFSVVTSAQAVDLNDKKFNEVLNKGTQTFKKGGNKRGGYSRKGTSSRRSLNNYTNSVLNSVQNYGLGSLRSSKGNSYTLYSFLESWLTSWKHTATYSSVYSSGYADKYHANFYAAYKKMYRSAWLNDKDRKGKAKVWIDVVMHDVGWEFINNGNAAVVVFDQVYKSDTYVDRGIKYLYLVRSGNSWKILREEQPDYVTLCTGDCSSYSTFY